MSRRLPSIVAAVLLVFGIAGFLLDRVLTERRPPEARARALAQSGHPDEARAILWELLQRGPVTTDLVLAYIEARGGAHKLVLREDDGETPFLLAPAGPDDAQLDALLARPDVPPETATLARYWRAVLDDAGDGASGALPELRRSVVALADRDPPPAWANRLLAKDAVLHERTDDGAPPDRPERDPLLDAARRFAREAAFIPAHREDADLALGMLLRAGDVDGARELLADPRVERATSAWAKFRFALETRDLRLALRTSWGATFERPDLGALALTCVAALGWLVILARLGDAASRPRARIPLYFAAIALGVVSVYPTLMILAAQESVFHLTEPHDGDLLRTAIYYFFGVGFREELSKLLLFLPLYPLVRRTNEHIDVLICGGLVGLGFGAEENLQYFAHGSLTTAMARYLTANFLHIASTALVCGAFDDMMRGDGASGARRAWSKPAEGYSFEFSRALVTMMAMHAAYDFFLSTDLGGASYLSMITFFVLARGFLAAVIAATPRRRSGADWTVRRRRIPVLDLFAVTTAVVVGASFVYAAAQVGPRAAALVMFQGLLGTFIFAYFFVQEFRRV